MASIRSKFLLFLLKNKDVFKPKSKRLTEIRTIDDVLKFREMVEIGAEKFGKLPKNMTVESIDIDGIYAEYIAPENYSDKKIIMYFHGGGLVSGSAKSHRGIVSKFVKASGIRALTFDYALAPEKPFPQGLDDSLKVYKYLLKNRISTDDILLMGDSGGGNLVLSLLLLLKEKSIPMPAGAITLSPWTDLTNSGDSNISNREKDNLTTKNANEFFSEIYCNGKNPNDPLISPLFGNLVGLPDILMFAGNDELMRDDTTRFAKKGRQAGVNIDVEIGEGMFHCYPAVAPLMPEATVALAKIVKFIKNKLL